MAGSIGEGGLEQSGLITHDTQVNHLATKPAEQAKQGVAVAVVHRTLAQGLTQAQDFVAGRKIGDLQAPLNLYRCQAQTRHQAQRGRAEVRAFLQGDLATAQVFAQVAPVIAELKQIGRDFNTQVVLRQSLDQLLWYYGV